ncbi:hypothetical protein K438DRAFT_1748837 [Mycena galopus ATCC 62051]|nr:hypothetical protein K438DRAFT_1748837 [Mycena galopus ATCC 62051]
MSATLEGSQFSTFATYHYLTVYHLLRMSSSNLPSSATYSPNRVRFTPEPVSPSPKGRARRVGSFLPLRNDEIKCWAQDSLPYPAVAQCKGCADRRYSFDLFWKLHTLSAVSDVIPVDAANPQMRHRPKLPRRLMLRRPKVPLRRVKRVRTLPLFKLQTNGTAEPDSGRV